MNCEITDRFKILNFETDEDYLKRIEKVEKVEKVEKDNRAKVKKENSCERCGIINKRLRWVNNNSFHCCDQCYLKEVENKGTGLTILDFEYYFKAYKLGQLCFPVGFTFNGYSDDNPFFINLNELYRLIIGWKIDEHEINIEELEIVAVIAFGSAVGPKKRTVEKIKSKFIFFGSKTTSYQEKYIQPKDVDFLIITKEAIIKEKVLKPVSIRLYDRGTCIKKGGIHLVNRSMEQCENGISEEDTISISALSKGIPIFCNDEFASFRSKISVLNQALYEKVMWEIDSENVLKGTIE